MRVKLVHGMNSMIWVVNPEEPRKFWTAKFKSAPNEISPRAVPVLVF
jgi:hypothetical protein